MGILSGIRSIFSVASSGSKVAGDVFDKDNGLLTQFGGWIDRSNFTDQEKASLTASQLDGVRKFVVDTLNESTSRSRARRDIAVFFIKFYAIMLFLCGMVYPINAPWSKVWFDLATSASVGGLVVAISIFFFGSHSIARYNESRRE